MNPDFLDELMAIVRRGRSEEPISIPSGFAPRVISNYRLAVQRERVAERASLISVCTAMIVFLALVGLNFGVILAPASDEPDPAEEAAVQTLWDSAGN